MAGHSKWANIKRQKARVDAVKGKTFAKISRQIIIAARNGVPDPAGNFQLRTAIENAKAAGIPNENIERAIAKGTGTLDSDAPLEEVRYEGYGAGGVAFLIEALTDNRNRTAADLRAAFNKQGGNLGETGCVGWMFDLWGVVTVAAPHDEEAFLEALLAAEVETYDIVEDIAEVRCPVAALEAVSNTLNHYGYHVLETERRWLSLNTVEVSDEETARRVLRLLDALETLDDIQTVATNAVISDALMEMVDV
ncbi:YebC/PmpR family DNA-binding transcriptional regulator [Parathermosynechococcus lividus]